ncbi:hypothetical protein ALT785_520019 [Alteromonas infernus]
MDRHLSTLPSEINIAGMLGRRFGGQTLINFAKQG